MTKKNGSAKLCNILTLENIVRNYTCDLCDLSSGNASTLAAHVKCKHGIAPVFPTADIASVSVAAANLQAVCEVESYNENIQLHSQLTSSSLNKKKHKNTDKYNYLRKRRLTYPAKFEAHVTENREKRNKTVRVG